MDEEENAPCCDTHLEGILLDGLNDIFEEDLRGECVTMVDDGLVIWSIPAVQLYAAAALQQSPGGDQTSDAQQMFTVAVDPVANHTWILKAVGEVKSSITPR